MKNANVSSKKTDVPAEDKPAAGAEPEGNFQLPPLPWPANALEPVISQTAVELHHGKHHRAYVNKLNALTAGTPLANDPLEEVVKQTAADPSKREIFNNAGQAWNHTFFFEGLKAPGPVEVPKRLMTLIEQEFGTLEALTAQLAKAGVERFGRAGPGWAFAGSTSRSPRRPTRVRSSPPTRPRSSRSTCGSTRTTSTTTSAATPMRAPRSRC